MKRTTATILMLAGLGGCATPDGQPKAKPFGLASGGREVPGVMGPTGEPVHVAAGQMPTDGKSGVVRADHKTAKGNTDSGIRTTAGFARIDGGASGVSMPGLAAASCADGSCGAGMPGPSPYGPMQSGLGTAMGRGGILPTPGMGPAGAVAAVGAIGATGGMYGPMYMNQRTSIRFVDPAGMKIAWQGPGGTFLDANPLVAPARYNFPQGNIYRLRLSDIPNRPTANYYPTLEVYPATPNTITFLSHNTVPIAFTNEDFDQVRSGNMVIKVIYLPFPQYQDLAALAGAEELVSTRLEPGVNPVEEANRRGTILAVIRIGNIDLQDPNTPAMDAPPGAPAGLGMPRLMGAPNSAPALETPKPLPTPPLTPAPAAPATPAPAAPKTSSVSTPITVPTVPDVAPKAPTKGLTLPTLK